MGGLAVGAIVSLASSVSSLLLPIGVRYVLLALVVVGLVATELDILTLHLPQRSRLVPQSVVHRGAAVGAFQFGFEMGTGLRTYMTAAAPYAVAVGGLLVGGLIPGMIGGLGFGIGRSVVVVATRSASDTDEWWSGFESLERANRTTMMLITAAALIMAAAFSMRL